MQSEPSVLDWLNRECDDLARLEGSEMEIGLLRRVALDDLREAFEFPMRVVLSGLVGEVRHLPDDDGAPVRYLELIPAGFSPAAYRVLGGVLFRCDRPLQAGSVVTVALELADPGTYSLHPAALLATMHSLSARVAVEP